MKIFQDTAGRTWSVQVDVAGVKAVRQALGVDLFRVLDDNAKPLGELVSDPVRLVDVVYVLCRDQVDKAGLTDVDFGRAFSGDVIDQAAGAFLEAFVDFFPDARARSALAKGIKTMRLARDRILARLERETAALDPAALAEQISNEPSTNSPASSASTPAL